MGVPDVQVQAVGLRHRRGDRRRRRRAVRAARRSPSPAGLPVHPVASSILAAVVLGGVGQHAGVILGRRSSSAGCPNAARASPSTAMLVFGAALVGDDDLPAAGPIAVPAAQAELAEGTGGIGVGGGDPEPTDAARGEAVAEPTPARLEASTMRFGGLTALQRRRLHVEPGRDLRADRAERRRQDHRVQRAHRRLPADRGRDAASTATALGGQQARTRSTSAASPARSRTSGCSTT